MDLLVNDISQYLKSYPTFLEYEIPTHFYCQIQLPIEFPHPSSNAHSRNQIPFYFGRIIAFRNLKSARILAIQFYQFALNYYKLPDFYRTIVGCTSCFAICNHHKHQNARKPGQFYVLKIRGFL